MTGSVVITVTLSGFQFGKLAGINRDEFSQMLKDAMKMRIDIEPERVTLSEEADEPYVRLIASCEFDAVELRLKPDVSLFETAMHDLLKYYKIEWVAVTASSSLKPVIAPGVNIEPLKQECFSLYGYGAGYYALETRIRRDASGSKKIKTFCEGCPRSADCWQRMISNVDEGHPKETAHLRAIFEHEASKTENKMMAWVRANHIWCAINQKPFGPYKAHVNEYYEAGLLQRTRVIQITKGNN